MRRVLGARPECRDHRGGLRGYGATTAALAALTRSQAAEFGPAGVRVNAVALGPSRTEVTRSTGDMLETFAAASPRGRPNEPDEVARVIACLAGEDARPVAGRSSPSTPAAPPLSDHPRFGQFNLAGPTEDERESR